MAKKKKGSQAWWKDQAWQVFSQWVRRSKADAQGNVECVTCGKIDRWKKMHAGHYVDGRNNTVLFNEKLVHPQCFKCNMKKAGCLSGNKVKYTVFMMKKYDLTLDEVDALDDLKFKVKDMTIADYQDIIAKYTDHLVGLDIRDESENKDEEERISDR